MATVRLLKFKLSVAADRRIYAQGMYFCQRARGADFGIK
jgi:hypothetical protein